MRRTSLMLMSLPVLVAIAAVAQPAGAEPMDWPTRPSDMRQLSFTRPGRIAEVLVEEGDTVEAGAVLVRQDDRLEREELKILKVQAEDMTRITFAEAALEKAALDLEIARGLAPGNNVTPYELREAELEHKLKQASLEIARIEQRQAIADYEQMLIRLDQMQLAAPVHGRVERIYMRQGEASDALEKVIVVVQTDPLWVDLPVAMSEAAALKLGQQAQVQFVNETGAVDDTKAAGKVVYMASVADAGSGTLTIRVEIPNPGRRPAGGHVRVTFEPRPEQAAEKSSPTGDGKSSL
ncbi:MAG: efflux RND transporter periplasmic adaptor subunit [Planctomycetes bacterium]|nr:efflux RND transporter periplasmic adaptor subunit [Planctomycetota bacterium]